VAAKTTTGATRKATKHTTTNHSAGNAMIFRFTRRAKTAKMKKAARADILCCRFLHSFMQTKRLAATTTASASH
jgi:hypothetical protein